MKIIVMESFIAYERNYAVANKEDTNLGVNIKLGKEIHWVMFNIHYPNKVPTNNLYESIIFSIQKIGKYNIGEKVMIIDKYKNELSNAMLDRAIIAIQSRIKNQQYKVNDLEDKLYRENIKLSSNKKLLEHLDKAFEMAIDD
jgi:hypothetical protein